MDTVDTVPILRKESVARQQRRRDRDFGEHRDGIEHQGGARLVPR